MKTNFKNLASCALALAISGVISLTLDSCVKDQFDESLGDRVTITLTAENPGFVSDAAPAAKSQANDTIASAGTSAPALAPVVLDSTATLEQSIAALGDRVVYSDSTMFICQPMGMAPDTKTGMDKTGRPFWEKGDQVGLFVVSSDNKYSCIPLSMKENIASYKAIFTGSVDYTIKNTWSFYPFRKQTSSTWEKLVSLEISNNQTPSRPDSFDGKSDILVGDKLKITENTSISINENVTFTRKVGFLKFALFDMQQKPIKDDCIKTLTFSVSDYPKLVGTCTLKLDTGELNIISGGNACTVTYPDNVNSSAAFISAFPGDIPANSNISIIGKTVNNKTFSVEKSIQKAINIAANQYTYIGLKVNLEDGNGGGNTQPGEISKTNAWLNFTGSNTAMATALQNNDMEKYNRILSERILLDYSYAGYMHGTAVPPAPETTGAEPQVYNVNTIKTNLQKTYKGVTDRQAFMIALGKAGIYSYAEDNLKNNDIVGTPVQKADAGGVVIYFPARNEPYVLHDKSDDGPKKSYDDSRLTTDGPNESNKLKNNPIVINAGNFIIAGDGPGKTILEMRNRNNPTKEAFYSTKEMILIKNPDTEPDDGKGNVVYEKLATVSSNAVRGSFSVKVSGATNLSNDMWVILSLDVKPSATLLQYELGGHETVTANGMMVNIQKNVTVKDYHQVKSWDPATSTLTFYEPIMREVDLGRDGKNWCIYKYNNYSKVGVENLTFLGHAPEKFLHHGGPGPAHSTDPWLMDGGYKPLTMSGLVNSWVRNVQFVSISECLRFKMCANSSAYNIEIKGNRGHAGVSSAGSSRMFIGNINDHSDGYRLVAQDEDPNNKGIETGAGQYHASGVSKPSMGAVLWKNKWGYDATFESHSGQPRATLVDNCEGGWVESRFGGDRKEIPNHLNDLTIWNMKATSYRSPNYGKNPFKWWTDDQSVLWRVAPPIVVGFNGEGVGAAMDKTSGQMKYYEEGCGVPSLYKAQLEERAKREPNATLQDWRTVLDGLQLPEWQYPTTN